METVCNDCARSCNAQRNEQFGNGFCGSGLLPSVSLAIPHYGEEPCISGENGSGTIFFSRCSLKCVFCQNYKISHLNYGNTISYGELAETIKNLESLNVHNINFVNPTHYTYAISRALEIYKPSIPIVYNTSSYENISTIDIAAEWTNVFLADLKLFSASRCRRYLGASNYFDAASKAIERMLNHRPQNIFKDGILKEGVIIRVLVLPCNVDEAYRIADFIASNWGTGVIVSIMSQFYPAGLVSESNFSELNRRLKRSEYSRVCDYFISKGFTNGFYQEISLNNDSIMTPNFNGEGIYCDKH